jgi:hypothetical protein
MSLIGQIMTHVYRITKSPDVGTLVDSEEDLEAFARDHGPGPYHVDEHSLDPFEGSNAKARGWGTIIHQPNGRIAVKPFFFGDHRAIDDYFD